MRGRRHPAPRVIASVLVVTVASGALFSISASTTRGHAVQVDTDLVGLVRREQQLVESMESDNEALRADVESALQAAQSGQAAQQSGTPSSGAAVPPLGASTDPAALTVTGLADVPVSGPGVTVTLTDAPAGSAAEDVDPDWLVVHQQDIEDVMNALWSGGAEAMTVQGARITAGTVVRCIGNVILIDGRSYSPPYEIAAIGDPDQLDDTLEADPRIRIYKEYVARYGLGWSVKSSDHLEFEAASQEPTVQYAQVMEDHG